MKWLLAFIVLFHGLIHSLGFIKAFGIAPVEKLIRDISQKNGLVWLGVAILFIVVFLLIVYDISVWWESALPALLISQYLIFSYWGDAKFGTIANIIIMIAAIVSYADSAFQTQTGNELKKLIDDNKHSSIILTEEMTNTLPPPVRRWLMYSGAVGKNIPSVVYLTQSGKLKTAPDGKWMKFSAEQWFTPQSPGFLWKTNVQMFPGFFLSGRDLFFGGKGSMKIKLLSLFSVADAAGEKTDISTMQRYLGEIVWFPAGVLEKSIRWEPIDENSAKAHFTMNGLTATADFRFDDQGRFLSIHAERYREQNGKHVLSDWYIHAFEDAYKEFVGITIPNKLKVIWKLENDDFEWMNVEITSIGYR